MAIIIHMNSLVMMITISLLMLIQNVNSTSFTFSNFWSPTKDIAFQGDADYYSGGLTPSKIVNSAPIPNSAGRAFYSSPVRLWDAKTGKLAAFTTTFSFTVEPFLYTPFGDGIAFFIAPFVSELPKNSSGGYLGLFNGDTALDSYKNQIVGVEFDSYSNAWDPNGAHIGIDVNSIASVTTTPWQPGNIAAATIDYEPKTTNLSVSVSYVNGSSTGLSFVIDLRSVLPEWVRVGFSGSTGQVIEEHRILSWSFSSTLY
ncbi:hypothetical protein PIB30_015876 [Stylosanthes scabra]|uniref:Legume lectin domain-containing protein n=1 Tax=Stylosanthes scabra TaxID=79078 RepID=A0ABU6S7D7_9FABA|nr:hypothetical protein [Stylosanthes scabra]